MDKKILATFLIGMAAAYAPAALGAKVGDSCVPRQGGAGHFVKSGITIKCQADPAIVPDRADSRVDIKKENVTEITDKNASGKYLETPKISGFVSFPIISIEEKISPLKLKFGEKFEETGEITAILDPKGAEDARLEINFDTMKVSLFYNLLINADVLRQHRVPEIHLSVVETGPLNLVADSPSEQQRQSGIREIFVQLSTFSSGSVEEEPIKGAIFRQKKGYGPGHPFMPACGRVIKFETDANGKVTHGSIDDPKGELLACVASGSLTFAGETSAFTGVRSGRIGSVGKIRRERQIRTHSIKM